MQAPEIERQGLYAAEVVRGGPIGRVRVQRTQVELVAGGVSRGRDGVLVEWADGVRTAERVLRQPGLIETIPAAQVLEPWEAHLARRESGSDGAAARRRAAVARLVKLGVAEVVAERAISVDERSGQLLVTVPLEQLERLLVAGPATARSAVGSEPTGPLTPRTFRPRPAVGSSR